MATINISLPSQLKAQADDLIGKGYFASFSDLVRTALRNTLEESPYDSLVREAIRDHPLGKTKVLKTKKDIDDFIAQHMV